MNCNDIYKYKCTHYGGLLFSLNAYKSFRLMPLLLIIPRSYLYLNCFNNIDWLLKRQLPLIYSHDIGIIKIRSLNVEVYFNRLIKMLIQTKTDYWYDIRIHGIFPYPYTHCQRGRPYIWSYVTEIMILKMAIYTHLYLRLLDRVTLVRSYECQS